MTMTFQVQDCISLPLLKDQAIAHDAETHGISAAFPLEGRKTTYLVGKVKFQSMFIMIIENPVDLFNADNHLPVKRFDLPANSFFTVFIQNTVFYHSFIIFPAKIPQPLSETINRIEDDLPVAIGC